GQALLAFLQRLAAVGRHVLQVFQERKIQLANERVELLVSDRFLYHQREVAAHRGEARQRTKLRHVLRGGDKARQVQLRRGGGFAQRELVGDFAIDPAEVPDDLLAPFAPARGR